MDNKLTYKELKIWVIADHLFRMIIDDSTKFPRHSVAYAVSDQVVRSIASISANIAEGSGRGTINDLIRFLIIARGSLVESQNWIDKIEYLGYITKERSAQYDKEFKMLCYKINALIGSLRRHPKK